MTATTNPQPVFVAESGHWTGDMTMRAFAASRGTDVVRWHGEPGNYSLADDDKRYRLTIVDNGKEWVWAVFEDTEGVR